ncbi:PAS domain-containing protein [Cohaesibacter haloalkalitolerans]|jgi:PAS domain S-box-containing protein|uniref:PAS domain-containing protein n=1 Tax=Cohaesibacter haloalkalitolerans TaxID=1162980 RepID=UPI000E65959F|nr:PAS domain-containing protein [Cohaesibacter haloalkalitolerans]
MTTTISPTGIERRFGDSEILVSRTDKDGYITYCNGLFRDITGYGNKALVGQPHNCMRHPDMPRSIFMRLWDGLDEAKEDVFAYVQNLATNGDHYWTFARISPARDDKGDVVGYEASRRVPNRTVVREIIEPLYKELCDIEAKFDDADEGLKASNDHLSALLRDKSTSYRHFVLSL